MIWRDVSDGVQYIRVGQDTASELSVIKSRFKGVDSCFFKFKEESARRKSLDHSAAAVTDATALEASILALSAR